MVSLIVLVSDTFDDEETVDAGFLDDGVERVVLFMSQDMSNRPQLRRRKSILFVFCIFSSCVFIGRWGDES